MQKGQIPWSIRNPDHQVVLAIMLDEFEHTDDLLHDYWSVLLKQKKKFDPWLEDRDDITAANALIILIQRATGLLGRQLNRLEKNFVEDGGFKEKMYQARTAARTEPDSPACPDCGGAMKKKKLRARRVLGLRSIPQMQRSPAYRNIRSLIPASPSHQVIMCLSPMRFTNRRNRVFWSHVKTF